jgi:hypothetical protein
MGSVSVGQLVKVWGMKYSPSVDAFVAADCTKSAGTATIGAVSLDRTNGGDDGGAGTDSCHAAVWSAIVTGAGTLTMQVGGAVAGSYLLIAAEAFNGSWDASRLEAVNGQLIITDATSSSTTGNGTSAGAALFCAALQMNTSAATTITPDAAFTTVYENETGTDDNGSAIYRIVSTGTTDAGDWTHGTTHVGVADVLTVDKEVAAGGFTAKFRKSLSAIGGRVGQRQAH